MKSIIYTILFTIFSVGLLLSINSNAIAGVSPGGRLDYNSSSTFAGDYHYEIFY